MHTAALSAAAVLVLHVCKRQGKGVTRVHTLHQGATALCTVGLWLMTCMGDPMLRCGKGRVVGAPNDYLLHPNVVAVEH